MGDAVPDAAFVELLHLADTDPYALSAAQRADVLAYSREQAAATQPAVDAAWNAALDNNTVRDDDAGPYEAALRVHGEHLGRAITMTALNQLDEHHVDEQSLRAAGAFDNSTDWDTRYEMIQHANRMHTQAWRDALRTELSHRSFGQVAVWAEFGTGMTKARQKEFHDLASIYPDGMIREANQKGLQVHARLSRKRAHFAPYRTMEVKKDAPMFVSTRKLISLVNQPTPGNTSVVDTLRAGLIFGSRTNRLPADDGRPPNGAYDFGVPNTPEHRAALDTAVTAWAADESMCRQFGKKPTVIEGDDGNLYVRSNKMRKVHVDSKPVAEITTNGAPDTTVHELAHRMEHANRRIGAATAAFLARRTQGLTPTVYAKSRTDTEMATEDSFVSHYVGKLYPDSPNATEVFSMGMEGVACGESGGLNGFRRRVTYSGIETDWIGRTDREHHALIIGLLSTASVDSAHAAN